MDLSFIQDKILPKALNYIEISEKILLNARPKNNSNRNSLDIRLKEDNSPYTNIDIEIENKIIKLIHEDFPDHKIIGEETHEIIDTKEEFVWIIDPLDGTKNYIKGLSCFSTQLALAYNEEIVLGISNGPFVGGKIHAIKHLGAYRDNKELKVSDTKNLNESFISYCDLRHFLSSKLEKNLLDIIQNTSWSRGYGDYWSYGMVANGRIDAMIEVDTKIWDFAAVSLITEEAGGRVTDLNGNKINFKTNDIVASNGKIHNQILKFFNPYD